MKPTRLIAALAFAAAALPAAPAHAACNVTVSFPNFSPASYTVQAGGTVTWCWTQGNHSVKGSFGDSGVRDVGAEYPITFNTPGTYSYVCGVHASMQASVVVQGSASPSPSKTASPKPRPTTTSPAPARTTPPPPPATTAPPTRFPTPTATPSPTTAAPTTTAPATTTPPATTSAPASPTTTPAALDIDPAPAKPKTGLAIALGLLVAVGGLGGAAWLLLRGRAG